MRLRNVLWFAALLAGGITAFADSHKEYAAKGDVTIDVFNKENVHFAPGTIGNFADADAGTDCSDCGADACANTREIESLFGCLS